MKKNKKNFLFLLIIFSFIFPTNILAATGYQGYAAYRDGVFFNYTWHAAIMDEAYSNYYLPVVHTPGKGYVKWDSWENFLDGNTFQGIYRPKSNPTSSRRDSYVSMARRLKDESISYNVAYQVYYNTGSTGYWVYPEDITSMRCDGVVEYVYEYYGDRVFGNDSNWDVTRNDFWIRDAHSGTAVTPKSQAQSYLTLVSKTSK